MGGTVAHAKLGTVLNRSLLTATAAVFIAGPLAGAAAAQLDTVTDPITDLTCEEAKKTKDKLLIEEF